MSLYNSDKTGSAKREFWTKSCNSQTSEVKHCLLDSSSVNLWILWGLISQYPCHTSPIMQLSTCLCRRRSNFFFTITGWVRPPSRPLPHDWSGSPAPGSSAPRANRWKLRGRDGSPPRIASWDGRSTAESLSCAWAKDSEAGVSENGPFTSFYTIKSGHFVGKNM